MYSMCHNTKKTQKQVRQFRCQDYLNYQEGKANMTMIVTGEILSMTLDKCK